MATIREIEVIQNSVLVNALQAKETRSPEEALEAVLTFVKAGMSAEQIAHCEKMVNEQNARKS